MTVMRSVLVAACVFHFAMRVACAAIAPVPAAAGIDFEQQLGAAVPLSDTFRDEQGRSLPLGRFMNGLPAVLLFDYSACPNLCSTVRAALAHALFAVDRLPGTPYVVLVVSIDPTERSAQREEPLRALLSAGALTSTGNWHFLTGSEHAIAALARSVGFRFTYDAASGQYLHPAGIVIVTPGGTVSRYLFGVGYEPTALRAGLNEAANGQVGSPIRALLLRCLHYDPALGKHSKLVVGVARALGILTVAALALLVIALRRKERRAHRAAGVL